MIGHGPRRSGLERGLLTRLVAVSVPPSKLLIYWKHTSHKTNQRNLDYRCPDHSLQFKSHPNVLRLIVTINFVVTRSDKANSISMRNGEKESAPLPSVAHGLHHWVEVDQ